jgi:hypothetical protein
MEFICCFLFDKTATNVVKSLDLENKVIKMSASTNQSLLNSSLICAFNISCSTTTSRKISSSIIVSFVNISLQRIENSNDISLSKMAITTINNYLSYHNSEKVSKLLLSSNTKFNIITRAFSNNSLRPSCLELLVTLARLGNLLESHISQIWKLIKESLKDGMEEDRIYSYQVITEIEKKNPSWLFKLSNEDQIYFFTGLFSCIAYSFMNNIEIQSSLVLLENILNSSTTNEIDSMKFYETIAYSGIVNSIIICIQEMDRNVELYSLAVKVMSNILVLITQSDVICELLSVSAEFQSIFNFLEKYDNENSDNMHSKVKQNLATFGY